MTKLSFYISVFSISLISACSHAIQYEQLKGSEKTSIKSAICSAENFLSKNGYLNQLPMSAEGTVDLEMWDNINYEKDGIFDWRRLLTDRAGTFTGRLYGAKINDDEHLIFYKLEESFRCVSVDLKRNKSSLPEANCLISKEVVRVKDMDVLCGK